MRQKLYLLFALSLLIVSYGCSPKKSDRRIISVTIQPQAYFLERLAGDRFDIHVIVPSGSSPESYDPAPSQIVELSKSEAYFLVGSLGFELAWKHKIQKNNPSLKMFDNSAGIAPIEGSHTCHNHSHDGDHDDDFEEVPCGGDPHIWSSPKTVLKMIENMYNALLELDSEHEPFYTERYNIFKAEVEALDRDLTQRLGAAQNKTFLIYHPSLGYLAQDYGFTQLPIEFEGKEPTPKYLAELTQTAKEMQPKVIFIQPEFDKKNAQVMSETLGIPTVTINPLAYEWEKELKLIVDALCQ